MKLLVRPADPGDLEALARLEKDCFSLPRSCDMLAVELATEGSVFLVVEEEADTEKISALTAAGSSATSASSNPRSTIIGYLSWQVVLDEVQVGNLCVAADHRHRGAGDALIKEMIRLTAAGRYKKILLEVRAGNRPAICLYQKNAFVVTGRRKNYYFKPVEDALLMDYDFVS